MIRWPFGRRETPHASPSVPAPPAAAAPVAGAATRGEVDAMLARGRRQKQDRRLEAAIATFDTILAIDPLQLEANYERANASFAAGRLDDAKAACADALARLPGQPDLLMLAGAIDAQRHEPLEALAHFEAAKAVNPALAGIDERIGEQLAFLGRGRESIAAYDHAIERQPGNLALESCRLFLLNHFGLLDRAALAEAHRRWGERLEASVAAKRRPHHNDRDPARRLRVGFVSPDLRNHPVAYWLESYLVAHDPARYEAHAFDVSPYAEDDVTRRLRTRFERWYRCAPMSHEELADTVRGQRIDVLVDLAGHTGHHRLATFALKPAPVQVSWFGYMNTTGLSTIDWRLTDAAHDPPGSEAYYAEKLWRLPSVAAFTPDPRSPEPGESPFVRNGRVTFASANNYAKVTEPVKDAWASILRGAPASRLRLIVRGGDEARVADAVRAEYVARGVDAARIDVLPFLPIERFLRFLAEADVALDPFPYGGGTTTLHTLWMGVPIVALKGESEMGRATPAALAGLGLPQFACGSVDAYVAFATALARDPAALPALRATLRDRLRASGAMDYRSFARRVEDAFRGMWRAFCEASPAPPPSAFTSSPRA
jgi:predicted O-linked N-acetylglucosamine transferase (SPINDLY family)